MSLPTVAVDYQDNVNFERLRRYRLNQVRSALIQNQLGAVLCFDPDNVRYATGSYQGEWSRDKMFRYALVPAEGDPILFDSRVLTHVNRRPERYPWLVGKVRNSQFLWRGAYQPQEPRADRLMGEIKALLHDLGLPTHAVGVDILDMQLLAAAGRAGLALVDGQQAMLEARAIKSPDEVELMRIAAAIAEAAFWSLAEFLRPGIQENEIVAVISSELIKRGSERVECVAVASGPNTNPHASLFSNRIVRPGEVVYVDIMHSFNGYHTCYYRSFVIGEATKAHRETYRRCRDWLFESISVVRPGITSADISSRWPEAGATGSYGVRDEATGFALSLGHGLGLSLWERPIISREVSLAHPHNIVSGMVLALETYSGAPDGSFGVRLEEEVVVTDDGHEVITKFPSDELTECPRS
jgi:Xaa-Pro aminopeptidase